MATFNITPDCSICCETFKIPKILPCGHTFCLDCISRYIGDKTGTFLCPICGQDVQIPEGGARIFTTNFVAQTTPQGKELTMVPPCSRRLASSPTQEETKIAAQSVSSANYQCPQHQRPVDYYCVSCHSLICHKCFVKDHHGHEYLDVECESTKEKAREFVSTSEKLILNKIKELEETHTQLVEASEKLRRYTEDACSTITKQTEKIIADIQTSSDTTKLDIRNTYEESEGKLNEARENIMEQMKTFKLDLETNLPSSTEDNCVPILASLPKIKELEKLCENMKDNTPVLYKYNEWKERDFSVNMGMLGSVVTEQYYLNKPNCFTFDVSTMKSSMIYSEDKWCSNGLTWSCSALKIFSQYTSYFRINIELLPADNPELDYCIVDGTVSILNIYYNSQTKTSFSNQKFTRGSSNWVWDKAISWSTFKKKSNGYQTSSDQFGVQLNITLIREISFNKV